MAKMKDIDPSIGSKVNTMVTDEPQKTVQPTSGQRDAAGLTNALKQFGSKPIAQQVKTNAGIVGKGTGVFSSNRGGNNSTGNTNNSTGNTFNFGKALSTAGGKVYQTFQNYSGNQSAYQQNLQNNQPKVPTLRSAFADIYRAGKTDPTGAGEAMTMLDQLMQDPNSAYYAPYTKPTNRAIGVLESFGIDCSNIDDAWFQRYSYLRDYYVYNGTTNTPSSHGKKASAAELASDAFWQVEKAWKDSTNAQKEWAGLQDELKYKANNPNRTETDDQIVNGVDWKKYPTLKKMLDSMTDNKGEPPIELNIGIDFSRDFMYGVLWAALNDGGTGNSYLDMANSYDGVGNVWKDNETIRGMMTPGTSTFSKYAAGMTLYEEGLYFGVYEFTPEVIEDIRKNLDWNDETAVKYFNNVLDAEEITEEAEDQLSRLMGNVDRWVSGSMSLDKALEMLDKELETTGKGGYSRLKQMDKSLERNDGFLTTTRSINYRKADVEQYIRDAYAEKDKKPTGDDTVESYDETQEPEKVESVQSILDECDSIIQEGFGNGSLPKGAVIVGGAGASDIGSINSKEYNEQLTNQRREAYDSVHGEGAFDQKMQELMTAEGKTQAGLAELPTYRQPKVNQPKEKTTVQRLEAQMNEKIGSAIETLRDQMTDKERQYFDNAPGVEYERVSENILENVVNSDKWGDKGFRTRNIERISDIVTAGYIGTSLSTLKVRKDYERLTEERDKLAAALPEMKENAQIAEYARAEIKDEYVIPQEELGLSPKGQSVDVGYVYDSETGRYILGWWNGYDGEDLHKLTFDESGMTGKGIDDMVKTLYGENATTKGILDILFAKESELDTQRANIIAAKEKYTPEQAAKFPTMDAFDDAEKRLNELDAKLEEGWGAYKQAIDEKSRASKYLARADEIALRNGCSVKDPEQIDKLIDDVAAFGDYESTEDVVPLSIQLMNYTITDEKGYQRGYNDKDADAYINANEKAIDNIYKLLNTFQDIPDEYRKKMETMISDLESENEQVRAFKISQRKDFDKLVKEGNEAFYIDHDPREEGSFNGFNNIDENGKRLFYAMYALDKEAAVEFYNNNLDELARAMTEERWRAGAESLSQTNVFGRAAVLFESVAMAPLDVIGSVVYLAESAITGQGDPWLRMTSRISKSTYGEIQKELDRFLGDDAYGTAVKGLYEILYNRGRSAAVAMTFGGLFPEGTSEIVQAMPIAFTAAADALDEAFENGAEPWQAWAIAAATFAAESVTEGIELGHMEKSLNIGEDNFVKDAIVSWMRGWAENAPSEVVGEVLNEVIEKGADQLAAMTNEEFEGEFSRRVAAYEALGKSNEEARDLAIRDTMGDLVHTAVISAFSPGADIVSVGLGTMKSYAYYADMASQQRKSGANPLATARDLRVNDIQRIKAAQEYEQAYEEKATAELEEVKQEIVGPETTQEAEQTPAAPKTMSDERKAEVDRLNDMRNEAYKAETELREWADSAWETYQQKAAMAENNPDLSNEEKSRIQQEALDEYQAEYDKRQAEADRISNEAKQLETRLMEEEDTALKAEQEAEAKAKADAEAAALANEERKGNYVTGIQNTIADIAKGNKPTEGLKSMLAANLLKTQTNANPANLSEAEQKRQMSDYDVDLTVLTNADGSNHTSILSTLGAVLRIDAANKARADASVSGLVTLFGDGKSAMDAVADLLADGMVAGANINTVKLGIQYAAVADGACRQLIQSEGFQNMTPEQKAKALGLAVRADAQSQNVQDMVKESIHDDRVNREEQRLMGEAQKGIDEETAKAKEKAEAEAKKTTVANALVNQAQEFYDRTVQNRQAWQDTVDELGNEFAKDPSDENMKAVDQAITSLKGAFTAEDQARQALEERLDALKRQEQNQAEAEAAAKEAAAQCVLNYRQQAEQNVQQMEQAELEAQVKAEQERIAREAAEKEAQQRKTAAANSAVIDAESYIEQNYPNASEEDKTRIQDAVNRVSNDIRNEAMKAGVDLNTVVSAMDILDQKKFVQNVEKKYGVKIKIVDSSVTAEGKKLSGPMFNGKYISSTNTILVDKSASAKDIVRFTLGHELLHVAEKSGTYKELANALLQIKYKGADYDSILAAAQNGDRTSQAAADVIGRKGLYDEKLKAMNKLDSTVPGAPITVEEALQEIVADEMGKLLQGDKELANRLAGEKPNVLRRIIDAIKSFMNRSKNLDGEWKADTKKIVDMLEGALKEAQAKNGTGVKHSFANGIEAGMTDDQRYDKLKGAKIVVPISKQSVVSIDTAQSFNDLAETISPHKLKNKIRDFARDNGWISQAGGDTMVLNNPDLGFPAEFSVKSIRETINQNTTKPGTFVALLPVLKESYEKAKPVVVEGDRYLQTINPTSMVESFANLLGAFEYNGHVIPVEYGIKRNKEDPNKVYIVATIKEDPLVTPAGITRPDAYGESSYILSIEDVIKNVKPEDGYILSSLPNQFLTEDQLAGKRAGLEKHGDQLWMKAAQNDIDADYPVNMTQERIGRAIAEHDGKAYMAYIDPADFIDLSTSDPDRVANESRQLIASELKAEKETPYLKFNPDTGEITEADGLKRMTALENSNVDNVAVLMIPETVDGKLKPISTISVNGNGNTVNVDGLIPVTKENQKMLNDTFSNSGSWFKYSLPTDQNVLVEDDEGNALATELPGGTVALNTGDKYNLATYTPKERQEVRKGMLASGKFTAEEVDHYLDDALSVASIIAQDKVRLDYEITDPEKSMVKSNSDYGASIDASTLCAKRLVYQGTFDAIQHLLPNTPLMPEDLIHLSDMMREMGYETPCGICYVESRRRNLDKYIAEWLGNYNGEYVPTIAEVSTTDGLEKIRKEHPQTYKDFLDAMNSHGKQNNPKPVQLRTAYKGEIRNLSDRSRQKFINHGGIRLQSFSDFETPHLLDMMQVVMDIAGKRLTSQAYTKVPNFAWVFGDTGIKINLSLIGKGEGVDENGNLIFDDVEGMPFEEAMKLRDRYSKNVGTILVGINDRQILAAMADPRIDYIIPFHSSGWTKEDMRLMPTLEKYTDYQNYQTEKDIDTGAKTTKNKGNNIAPVGAKDEYGNGYWDFKKSGKENAEKYLDLCYKNGLIPVFSQFLDRDDNGHYHLKADGSTDGYWKMLIDFKMYENGGDGSNGKVIGAPQEEVVPNINMAEAYRVLSDYKLERKQPGQNTAPAVMKDNNSLPVAMPVVERYVEEYKATHPLNEQRTKYSISPELEQEYQEAVESNDPDWQAQLVNQAAYQAGYTTGAYHGSPIKDITSFKTRSDSEKKERMQLLFGTHFTQSKDYAEIYAKKTKSSKGTSRMGTKYGRVYDVALDLGKSLDLQTAKNYTPDTEMYQLYMDLPANIRKKYQPHTFSQYDTEMGLGEGQFITASTIEQALQSMTPKAATDFLVNHGYNSVKYLADYSTGMANNRMTRDPSIIMLDPERIKSAEPITYDDNGKVIPLGERFNRKSNDIRYSLPSDAPYLNAVNRGDTETAQAMVDQKAKEAKYNVKVYHGTANGGRFNTFDAMKLDNSKLSSQIGQGFYFTNSRQGALEYTRQSDIYGNTKPGVNPYLFEGYLRIENPIEVSEDSHNLSYETIRNIIADGNKDWHFEKGIAHDLQNETINGRKYTKDEISAMNKQEKIDLYTQYLFEHGDKFALQHMVDAYKYGDQGLLLEAMKKYTGKDGIHWQMKEGLDQFVAFDSSQFKDASAITYDDNGNVIPLSQRFNRQNNDIRYSLPSDDVLDQQIRQYLENGGSMSMADVETPRFETNPYGTYAHTDETDNGWNGIVSEKWYDVRGNAYKIRKSKMSDNPVVQFSKAPDEDLYVAIHDLGLSPHKIEGGWVWSPNKGVHVTPAQIRDAIENAAGNPVAPVNTVPQTPVQPQPAPAMPQSIPGIPLRMPETNTGMTGQRQWGREGAQRSDELYQQAKDYVLSHNEYAKDTNAQQINRAIDWIISNRSSESSDGFAEALQAVTSDNFNYASADGQARMLTVMGMAVARGDVNAQIQLADAYNAQGTDIARALQARKIFRMMTPEGRVAMMKKLLSDTRADLGRKGQYPDLKFSDWIYMAARSAQTEADFDALHNAAYEELADQIPATWKDKLQTWRMTSMLANPRTHVRNVLGNLIFVPTVQLKNTIATGLENAFIKEGERTKSIRHTADSEEFAAKDLEAMRGELTGEAKYSPQSKIKQNQKAFGQGNGLLSRTLGRFEQGLADFNSDMLEKEDWIFLNWHYRNAMASYMTANKLTSADMTGETLERARTYAVLEAQKATYRDANAVSSWLNEASRKGGLLGFTVDTVLPFKKTPANILRRGVEYSPIGLIKSLVTAKNSLDKYNAWVQNGMQGKMPKGAKSVSQVLDSIAAGMTGTMIAGLGALGYALGAVKLGFGGDDKDELEKLRGSQEYSIELFGYSFTVDWAAPVCMPFFTGASLYKTYQDGLKGEASIGTFVDSLSQISEPVFELSMLDGVNSLLKTIQGGNGQAIWKLGQKIGANYLGSMVPSRWGATARTIDTTRRRAYTESGEPLQAFVSMFEQAQNKIPFLSMKNIPYRDVWGNPDTNDMWYAFLENFILPGYGNKLQEDKVADAMERIYDSVDLNKINETQRRAVIPKEAGKTIGSTKLNDKQYDQYVTTRGHMAYELLSDLIERPEFISLYETNPEAQARIVGKLWDYVNQISQREVIPTKDVDKWIAEAYENGNPIESIFAKEEENAKKAYASDAKKELFKAIDQGSADSIDTYVEALRQSGKDDKWIRSEMTKQYKSAYKAAYLDNDYDTMDSIRTWLMYLDIGKSSYTSNDFNKWANEAEKEREED